MRRVLALVIAVLLVMGMLAGCQKKAEVVETNTNENGAQVEAANNLSGKTVTVGRWGGNDSETAAFNKAVTDFTAKTGIKVVEKVYSDYNTELQVELIGGTAPDVFYVDAYMAPFFIEQGVLTPLNGNDFEIDAFYQSLRDAFIQDGKVYAISKDYSTLALYYNKKYVNEKDIPTTLEELWNGDFLTNLKKTLPEGMAAMTYNQDLARKMHIAQAGGASIVKDDTLSNIADPAIVNNLRPLIEAAQKGKIVTPKDLGVGWNGDALGNEKTAMMIEGNWVLGHMAQNFPNIEFGVMEVPTFAGKKGTMVFTVGYGINTASKEKEAAAEFIKYITGKEGMTTWTTGAGVLPSRKDVADATNVASDINKIPHIAGAAYATPWQKGTTMDTINNEFKNYLPAIVKKEKTLEEGLKLAQEEANKIILGNK